MHTEAILGQAHDTWLQGFGLDIDKLRAAAGGGASPAFNNPSLDSGDPAQRSALVDTTVEFGKGFVKGVGDTAGGIVNSPGGQFVSGQVDPMGTQLRRAVDAAVTGDPSKLAPPSPFDNLKNVDPNDPKQQQKAKADVESMKDLGMALMRQGDPLALARSAPAVADVLVNGDPNQVGQGAGKVFVVGVGVAVGGVAGLGEAGVAEAGTAEAGTAEAGTAEAGAAEPPVISPLAGEVPPPESFGGAPTQLVPQAPGISPLAGEVPAPESFGGAPTQPVPQAPGPISSLDPAFGDAPAPQAPGPISSLDPALGTPEPVADLPPESAQPETLDPADAPTLREPPIPNPKQPFPEPDITLKPFERPPLRTITVDPPPEPAPEGTPDTERIPESSAPDTVRTPESSAPDTVPDTVRTPDLDPPPSSVQPEAPTVPAGPPSVDPADPIIPQAPRLPSFGPGNPEPIDPTAPTERAPVPEPVAEEA